MRSWERFLQEQKKILGEDTYNKWLSGITVKAFDARNLYLEAKDCFQESWFKEQLLPSINLVNNNGHPVKIHIDSKEKKKKKETSPTFKLEFVETPLSDEVSFSSLMQYKENQEAFLLLQSLDEKIELAQFNPIVLFGPVKTGKTSLLMATAKKLKEKGYRLFFVDARRFTEHVVSAIRQFQMKEFRDIYRNIDILIIDGIDIFTSKNATQEEFFHTFNALHLQKKQIIVSCKKAPHMLELEPRIISRMEWGLSLALSKPGKESICSFVAWKEEQKQIFLCSKCKTFIQDHPNSSLEAIELFFDLLALNSNSSKIIFSEIKQTLEKCFRQEVNADDLIAHSAQYFGLKSEDLLGKSQKKEISFPRQIAMFLCRKQLKTPYQQIGKLFKRDHSTVINAVAQIEKLLVKKDPYILKALSSIQEKCEKI